MQSKDLIILVADKNMEYALKGLLSRSDSLGICTPLEFKVYPHPQRDPGCFLRCQDFLRPFFNQYAHALVMFDHMGCGRESKSREVLEDDVEKRLSANGWENRATAIVIEPELESWIWVDLPQLEVIVGWEKQTEDLQSWLLSEELAEGRLSKPIDPKRALEKILQKTRKRRSSSIYLQLAQTVNFEECPDPSFRKLRLALSKWFPRI